MNRTLSIEALDKIGQEITVKGWVNSRRDHGGLIFIDLRDHKGLIQLTIQPGSGEAFGTGEQLRDEFVISATGIVKERDENLKNPNIDTGSMEIIVSAIEVLNRSEPLPIQVNTTQNISEDNRLRYRYLDLRRPKMQSMLRRRSAYYEYIRRFMSDGGFTEVATPVLANSSPEGARDFLVPSRVHPGKVYALPQAPQQFKQLLMVGGLDKYYQIATCFRDEDPRADRLYGDFYQLDLEMSFVDNGETVRSTLEPLIKSLVTDFAGLELVNQEVPRIRYQDAMNKYGSDKPDLRFGMELIDLTDDLQSTEFGVFANTIKDGGVVKAICVGGASGLSRSQIDKFTDIAKQEGAGGLAYILIQDGVPTSPITKFLSESELQAIVQRTGAVDGDGIFFGVDKLLVVNKVLGRLRNEFADYFALKDPRKVALAWVVDFPFYEWDETNKKVDFGHNPFSMPKGGVEALSDANTDEERLAIVADQYDMVMNGYEICSGAVRNHSPDVMYKAFGALGYGPEYVESKFGAVLSAFKFGAPPHAGCAFGLDRIFMILEQEDNIREVVAFPKNGSGVDVMMNSPSVPEDQVVKDLNIQFVESET